MSTAAIRRAATSFAKSVAMSSATLLGESSVGWLERRIAQFGPHVPILARLVADNMRALGVYSPAVHREHFRRIAAHLADALHVWRFARRPATADGRMPPEFARLVETRIQLHPSIDRLRDAISPGRGIVLIGPHIIGFLLSMARLTQAIPLTVYLRYSKDARKRREKEEWRRLIGLDCFAEQARPADAMTRISRMTEIIAAGRVLYITPDLPHKRGEGKPVSFFGRQIFLPPGAPLAALRADAPLYFLTGRAVGAALELAAIGPFEPTDAAAERRVQTRILARLQWFAIQFERFVREQPALWYFWADKRWTRVLQGDAEYSDVPPLLPAAPPHHPATAKPTPPNAKQAGA